MKVLYDLRLGSEESFQFITQELSRPIRHNANDNLVELCFTRMEEEYRNACKLRSVEGQSYMFVSEDEGTLSKSQGIIPKKLCTKVNAAMICLANINQTLHNGTKSKIDNNKAEVEVDGSRFVVERWCWTNATTAGQVAGFRKQILLKLNWA